ncbi:MFS transporter [Paenibacillus cremeus]|uniref:MFS transporter n=1 Tax=Paenibacillus cremeus TaxID=2163881 RepID=A0A559KEG8_9BACL|nr:MFS transporter [Paenibacillus cremeus]TVY10519.1 MFS transporter [Paenibacillus cremeus]
MNSEKMVSFLGLQMNGETWRNFRWDFTAAALFSIFNVVFNQFYVPLALRHGASDFQVGLLTAAPAIGLLSSPLWASLAENRDPKPFVVIPNFFARMLVVFPAIFPNPWVFVGAALLFHLLMGIQAPTYASVMTRIYPAALRGRLMGNVRVIMGLLMIPLAYLVGLWIDHAGSSGPLLIASVTGVCSILALNRVKTLTDFVPSKVKQRTTFVQQLRLVKQSPLLIMFLAATTVSGFGNMLASPLYSIIQVSKLQLTDLEIGYIRVAYYACLLVAYLVMGWVIDRFSPRVALSFGMAFYMLPPLLYSLIGTYPAVLLAGGIQGMGDAIWDIGCMAYVFKIAKGREGVVFGLHLMLFGVRGTIGPLLSTSLIHSVSMEAILISAALCCVAGFLIFTLARGSEGQALSQSEA